MVHHRSSVSAAFTVISVWAGSSIIMLAQRDTWRHVFGLDSGMKHYGLAIAGARVHKITNDGLEIAVVRLRTLNRSLHLPVVAERRTCETDLHHDARQLGTGDSAAGYAWSDARNNEAKQHEDEGGKREIFLDSEAH
jgi:hypothetical protein